MKQLISLSTAALLLAACNNSTTSTTETTGTTTTDTTHVVTTETHPAYTPAEGDIVYKEKKVQVYRNGTWVTVDKETRLDNGTVVYPNGTVRKDDNEQELKEGDVVNKNGDFLDRTGNKIDNAWDSTKAGVKKVGKAIGNAAKKVGDKIEGAMKKD